MLRPLVRINRCPHLPPRCPAHQRHIHATPRRAVDEPQDPSAKPPAQSRDDEPPQEESVPRPSRPATDGDQAELRSAESERPRDAWPDQSDDIYDPIADEMFSSKLPAKDNPRQFEEEFPARRREHVSRVVDMRKKFNLNRSALDQRTQEARAKQYAHREIEREASNQRGLEVFEMINKAKEERGERPLLYKERERRKVEASGQGGFRRWDRGGEGSGGRRQGGWKGRDEAEETTKEEDDKLFAEAKLRELEDRRNKEIPEGSLETWGEPYPPHIREKKFVLPFDEVDYEVGYDLPDAEVKYSEFRLLGRDGKLQEHRRTTRDHDMLPHQDDMNTYFDIGLLGSPGGSYYFPKLEDFPEVADVRKEIERRIEDKDFPEDNEQDPAQLFIIEQEIKDGKTPTERGLARREREIEKIMKKYYAEYTKDLDLGSWAKQVPWKVPHDPTTHDLEEYVPPKFTHNTFRYGTPAVPFGVQGRERAIYAAAADPVLSAQPYRIHQFETSDMLANIPTPEEHKRWNESKEHITDAIEDYEEPTADWFDFKYEDQDVLPLRMTVRKTGPTEKRRGLYGEPVQRIEDMYDPRSLAVWDEMHKDWLPDPEAKFPEYDTENEFVTAEQEKQEAVQQVKAWAAMDQLDNALLKTFRRRDKYEIKDIRRRLGLSWDAGMDPDDTPVKTLKLSGGGTLLDKPQLADSVHKGEIVNEEKEGAKPDNLHPTEQPEFLAKLAFWLEAKKHITVLSSRIEQLRLITRQTLEQLRRHSYAIGYERRTGATGSAESIRASAATNEEGIVAKLHQKFESINAKFKQLEMFATAVIEGPGGPQTAEYSEEWIEWHVHQEEKKEFAKVAEQMGFQGLEMEPQATPQDTEELGMLEKMWYDSYSRIGIGGEYQNSGITPETQEDGQYGLLANYVAQQSNMTEENKALRLAGFNKTFEQRGWHWNYGTWDEEDEEGVMGTKEERQLEEEKEVDEDGEEELEADEAPRTLADDFPEVKDVRLTYEGHDMDLPIDTTPPPRIPLDEQQTMNRLRTRMRESKFKETFKDLDEEINSLEKDYQAFLTRNPSHSIPEESSP